MEAGSVWYLPGLVLMGVLWVGEVLEFLRLVRMERSRTVPGGTMPEMKEDLDGSFGCGASARGDYIVICTTSVLQINVAIVTFDVLQLFIN